MRIHIIGEGIESYGFYADNPFVAGISERVLNHEEDYSDMMDIEYTEDELNQFKSIKNVFCNREQFSKKAKVSNTSFKFKQSNLDPERSRYTKNRLKYNQSGSTSQKYGSFNKIIQDPNFGSQEGRTAVDASELEEDSDPRDFKMHGKTFRFCRTSLNCLDNRNLIRKL